MVKVILLILEWTLASTGAQANAEAQSIKNSISQEVTAVVYEDCDTFKSESTIAPSIFLIAIDE